MNEAEFVVKRVLQAAENWSQSWYEEKKETTGLALYYRNKRAAQQEILQYIKNEFLNEGKNE